MDHQFDKFFVINTIKLRLSIILYINLDFLLPIIYPL